MTVPSCRVGRWIAGLLLAALALTGCDRSEPPEQELRSAVERTLTQDLAFTVSARADRASLDTLGAGAAEAAAFLATFQIAGTRSAEGPYALLVDIGGTTPLLEARGGGGEGLLLRTGLGGLLGAGGDPAEALAPRLDELGIEGEQREALIAAFAGEWIALSDADDLADLAGADEADEPTGRDLDDPFDLEQLFAALEVRAVRDVGEVRRFEVSLDADAWLGDLLGDAAGAGEGFDVPSSVPGSVTVRDGLVHELRLELVDADAPPDTAGDGEVVDEGRVEVVVRVHDHGDVEVPGPVSPVVEITVAELAELITLLDGPLG